MAYNEFYPPSFFLPQTPPLFPSLWLTIKHLVFVKISYPDLINKYTLKMHFQPLHNEGFETNKLTMLTHMKPVKQVPSSPTFGCWQYKQMIKHPKLSFFARFLEFPGKVLDEQNLNIPPLPLILACPPKHLCPKHCWILETTHDARREGLSHIWNHYFFLLIQSLTCTQAWKWKFKLAFLKKFTFFNWALLLVLFTTYRLCLCLG